MTTKSNPGQFDCYKNALPDEPMFVLLGRDPYAPFLLRLWAYNRQQEIEKGIRPEADCPMVTEALSCALDMQAWRTTNDGKWRQGDEPKVQAGGVGPGGGPGGGDSRPAQD